MKKKCTVQVEKREALGTGPSRRLRHEGLIPAVLYGHGKHAVSLTIAEKVVQEIFRHPGLITLEIQGQKTPRMVIVKDIQYNHLTGKVIHCDLQEVRAGEIITSTVSIEPHGEPAGARNGGQLEQAIHDLEIKCHPADMIDVLTVDISAMEVDEAMLVKDLILPADITVTADPEQLVFQVRLPKAEEEPETEIEAEAEAEAEAGAEPELIGKKEKEEESAE